MDETNRAQAPGAPARRTRPCQWCRRPVPQRFPLVPKLHCGRSHWLNDVRDNFWRRLFDNP
ncbi:hypothetical protein [Streptomyces sp. H34-S4]|uniref:hypothetical protein n=1 Tax=Streptomyces sp. H34-S4 TaxID=2996463 RepID=UPI00226FF2E5|nr:hypothetical protein [Streptomyces sp. H34-S4]MCY0938103.1 hypothetical protein [Streptomyces sp. H34-S4]